MREPLWDLHLNHPFVILWVFVFITAVHIVFGNGHAFDEGVELMDLIKVKNVSVLVLNCSQVTIEA